MWQAEHVLMKTALPAFALPTSFGVALRMGERGRCEQRRDERERGDTDAGPTPNVERSIQNLRWLTAGCALGL